MNENKYLHFKLFSLYFLGHKMENCLNCNLTLSEEDQKYNIFEKDLIIQKCLVFKIHQITGDYSNVSLDKIFICQICYKLLLDICKLEDSFKEKHQNKFVAEDNIDDAISVASFSLKEFNNKFSEDDIADLSSFDERSVASYTPSDILKYQPNEEEFVTLPNFEEKGLRENKLVSRFEEYKIIQPINSFAENDTNFEPKVEKQEQLQNPEKSDFPTYSKMVFLKRIL